MSDTDQPVAEAQKCPTCGSAHGHSWYRCAKSKSTEPVATLPACLCGLDTNPVASPRMDIHCPKHDAPEAVGEPELPHEVTIVGCPHQPLSLWPPTCVVQHVDNELQVATYTRVSQPAGEPSDGPLLTREQYQEQCKRPFYPGRDIHRYVGSKAPGQACETCDLSWVHENHARMISTVAAAQPASTPADEEFQPWYENYERALRLQSRDEEVARELWNAIELHETSAESIAAITTALAEARRAGTPTTDARAKSVVDHLFTILARDYNIELTNNDASELTETVASALSSTPSDKVAQRARATAKEIHKRCDEELPNIPNDSTSYAPTTEEIVAIILKHFTATDVDQGTCTEHEK